MNNKSPKTKSPVRDKALSLLARYDRTEQQIRTSLAKSGYEENEIDDAISFLVECEYINDASYAAKYLEVLISKGRGKRRVSEEMRRHGLSREIIDVALEAGYTDETEKELALATAEKALAALPDGTPRRDVVRRISQKLTAQGHSYDIISWAIDRVTRAY